MTPKLLLTPKQFFANQLNVIIVHANFKDFAHCLGELGITTIDGIFADLGLSSPQLDRAARGFSFQKDGPIDMRMDNSIGTSAAQWLAQASEADMASVFKQYGEEKQAKRIARAIVHRRPHINSTATLANCIAAAIVGKPRKHHPATKTFQAIRIFINDECNSLKQLLQQASQLLALGGRLVFISFHSLEDRIVKHFFRDLVQPLQPPSYIPITQDKQEAKWQYIGKIVRPSESEIVENVRSRSATMRVIEKLVL